MQDDLDKYEVFRMSQRPKPKFLLEVVNPYRARPSRSTIWDMVAVALMGASWMAILFGLYLLMK